MWLSTRSEDPLSIHKVEKVRQKYDLLVWVYVVKAEMKPEVGGPLVVAPRYS
jgi:hypothetical protein